MKEVVLKAWKSQLRDQEKAVDEHSDSKSLKKVAKPSIAEHRGLKLAFQDIPSYILSDLSMLLTNISYFFPIDKVISDRTDP